MESFQVTKPQILALVRTALENGTIERLDLAELLGSVPHRQTTAAPMSAPQAPQPQPAHADLASAPLGDFSMTQLLQYIGGFIVLLGIGTFIATFWGDLLPIQRAVIAAGAALTAYVLGTILFHVDTRSQSGVAFHLVAGCLMPFAALVSLQELFSIPMSASIVSLVSLAILLIYAGSYYVMRHLIFTFFMLSASIAFLYSTLYVIIPFATTEMWAHLTLIIGALGIMVGRSFKGTHNEPLSEMMYFLGGGALLVSPAVVFGSMPVWEVLYPFVIAFALYLAVFLHSKRLLTLSVLAMMGYVTYLTGRYFADVVGWPIALIVTGVLLIAIGYATIKYKDTI